jgi:hypothetical protein
MIYSLHKNPVSGWNKRIKCGREGALFLEVGFLKFILFYFSKIFNEEIKLISFINITCQLQHSQLLPNALH